MASCGQSGHQKGEGPSLVLSLPHDLLRGGDASLLTPETMGSGVIAPMRCCHPSLRESHVVMWVWTLTEDKPAAAGSNMEGFFIL